MWSYWNLLAQIVADPEPTRFNQTAEHLVQIYFDSAQSFEASSIRIFGDDFFGEQQGSLCLNEQRNLESVSENGRDQGSPDAARESMVAVQHLVQLYPILIAKALLTKAGKEQKRQHPSAPAVISALHPQSQSPGRRPWGAAEKQRWEQLRREHSAKKNRGA